MSRQVGMDFTLNEKPVVTSMDKMIKKFEELNNIKEKLAPNGKIKIQIDSGNVKDSVKGINDYHMGLKNATAEAKRLEEASKKLGGTSKPIKEFGDSFKGANENIVKTAGSIIVLQTLVTQAMRGLSFFSKEMLSLTNNTYGVGVASQMTAGQISKLNDKFLELSKGTPVSAKDLAKATDDLVRTGRTFGEAQMMMSEISKLSVASGESLKDTAQVATKIMVSLGIEAENTKQTLNALHSVAIQTASSMGGLSESFKQFAGTLGMYANETTLQGEALRQYKQDILELGLSATGVLNNLGLSAGFQMVA
ncbi:MAG: phage tail tape measure protein [Clostridium sp.]|uniref:phage tail tape measure protein n=1 Tax=Clostridium sp. TaxID=1506 RepID=UPI003EE78B2F